MTPRIEHTPHSEEFLDAPSEGNQERFLETLGTNDPSRIKQFLDSSEQSGDITLVEHINPEQD